LTSKQQGFYIFRFMFEFIHLCFSTSDAKGYNHRFQQCDHKGHNAQIIINSKLVRFHCIWSSYQLGISCPDLRYFGENLGIDPWNGQNYFHHIPPDSSCSLAIAYSELHKIDNG
jgi:hypothetical protein